MTPVPVTPRVASITAVATGGTAVVAFTGPVNGFLLRNPTGATDPIFWSLVDAATTTAGGTISDLPAGNSVIWDAQLASGVQLSVNCAAAQSFTCFIW